MDSPYRPYRGRVIVGLLTVAVILVVQLIRWILSHYG